MVARAVYDWLLLLHVAAAFALGAALVVFTVLTIAIRREDRPLQAAALFALDRPATALVVGGSLLTLVFGVWLTIYLDGYELWDAWIVAAIVLWVVASEAGRRAGAEYTKAATLARRLAAEGDERANAELRALNQTRRGLGLHILTCAAVLAILSLMIYKPGA